MNQKTIGIFLMLGVGLMWALQALFVKYAYKTANTAQTAFVMTTIIVIGAALYSIYREKQVKAAFSVSREEFSWILAGAILGTLIADMLYLYALKTTPIVNVVLIGHLQPIVIIFLSYFVFKKEIPNLFDYLGVFAMIICAVLVSSGSFENLIKLHLGTMGSILVLIATALWAICAIIARKHLHDVPAGKIILYRFLVSTIFLLFYLLMVGSSLFGNYFQILVGVSVTIGYIFYFEAIKKMKAHQVGSLELTAPFFGAILGFVFLGEVMTLFQLFGLVFLLFGIYFLGKEEK